MLDRAVRAAGVLARVRGVWGCDDADMKGVSTTITGQAEDALFENTESLRFAAHGGLGLARALRIAHRRKAEPGGRLTTSATTSCLGARSSELAILPTALPSSTA